MKATIHLPLLLLSLFNHATKAFITKPHSSHRKINHPFTKNNKKQTFITTRIHATASNDDEKDKDLTNAEVARYSRHLVLGDVGVSGQKSLKNSKVLVIGAGGLGSPCLLYLAAAGVGTLGVVDADTVDESNLQRQIIHGTSTIDLPKAQSAKSRISDINPYVKCITYEEEFTSSSALRILNDQKWDVVVDGSDNFPTKYLINDSCDIAGIPWVYAAILAFEGQVSVFNYPVGVGPTYRDLMPTPPPPGDVPSCAEGGVLGVLPGTMGCIQATEVMKIVLGKDVTGVLTGRLLVYDALGMRFSEVGVQIMEGRDRVTELIDYQGFCAGPKAQTPAPVAAASTGGRTMDEAEDILSIDDATTPYHSIDPKEALSKLSTGWSPWVLDVRLQSEHEIVSLPFTDKVVPHRKVQPSDIPKEGEVLVLCKAGIRGKKACARLIELGVDGERLYNLDGGIMKWQMDVDPSMPRY